MNSGRHRIDFWVKNNNLFLLLILASMGVTFLVISLTIDETDTMDIHWFMAIIGGLFGVLGMRFWGSLVQSEDVIERQCHRKNIFTQDEDDNRYVLCSANLVEARAVRTTVGTGFGKRIAGISIGAGIARSKSE